MKRKFLILMLLACTFLGHAQVNRPKLVVGIVVDQMRWDYLYFYNKETDSSDFCQKDIAVRTLWCLIFQP